jgi:hypothetical protein
MKEPAAPDRPERDEETGLSWPRTWRGVYLLVLGSFILWVALLIALTNAYG